MFYPPEMTAREIMEFEYDYNRYLDRSQAINAEIQTFTRSEDELIALSCAGLADRLGQRPNIYPPPANQ